MKKILIASFAVFALGLIFDYYGLFDPEMSEPLFIFGFGLTVSSAILLFSKNQKAILSWKKFAFWWLILSVILILATPTSHNTWMPLYSVDREIVTWLMGGLFTLISLLLIGWKSLRKS